MKTILKQIDKLTEQIENGMYTKQEALLKIRGLKYEIECKYDVGSENYTICLYTLLDAYNSVQSI